MKLFFVVLQCISVVALAMSECRDTSQCRDTEKGRACTLHSPPERTALIGDRFYVGVADDLVAYSLDGLRVSDCVNRGVTEERSNYCVNVQGHSSDECRNFIRVIQPVTESASARILVCGTNAYTPKCTLHSIADLGNYTNMTDTGDNGFCPYSNTVPNVAVLATNGRFFSGTHFQQFGTHRTIGMAPKPLERNNTFTAKTPRDDPLWLNQPDFVSAYEIGDYIYFFAREIAYETMLDGPSATTTVYARAFRVCKEDAGMASTDNFLTFQKARMKCTNSGERNSIPYDYDNLKATFLWTSEDSSVTILYATFSSPVNGPEGAAICKFSFDESSAGSLTDVFNDGQYISQSDSGSVVHVGNFQCDGSGEEQRTEEEARMYQLVANPATPLDPQPLHVVSGSEYSQIAVDVVEYQGQQQEILYYSLNNGELWQCVITQSGQKYDHIIHSQGQSIHSLDIHKDPSGELRTLLATTDDSVVSIPLGSCSSYSSCWECVGTQDPYCAWDEESGICVSKFTSTSSISIYETVSVNESTAIRLCGPRPEDPSPTSPSLPMCPTPTKSGQESSSQPTMHPEPTSTTHTLPATDTSPSTVPCIPLQETVVVTAGGVDGSSSSEDISIPELVGATLGGFIVGLPVGLVICAVFFVVFMKKRGYKVKRPESSDAEHQPGLMQVNNRLDINKERKEQCLRNSNHYIDTPLAIPTGPPVVAEKKNVNQYEEEEGSDDVLTELPSVSGRPPKVLQKPKTSSRGRTDSTRALMHSVSSESSGSPGNTPLDSPS